MLRHVACVLLPAVLLAGCGNASSDSALEARIAAAEAKAEAADKRSRQALSMAASGSSSQDANGGVTEVIEGDPTADDSAFNDDSPDAPMFETQMESPPSPPIMPGG
ncbi:MAG: hypothetical protein C0409_00555 [Novosphingobium sp.]|nr:hypothetical protein [Novosphingobium sp.]